MNPLEIGGSEGKRRVAIGTPLVLAPLAGHTDRAFRALVRDLGGCGLVVTEMVSSEGLTRGSEVSRELAAVSRSERPVGIQVFGCDPRRMADAAAMVEGFGADLVDVNMGCPVPKVTRNGAGAALMRDVERAGEIVSRMSKAVRIPVTVKIRSGWDEGSINAAELARRLESAGASAVTVHPRCRSDRHRGRAAWKVIADVKRAVDIPVIGNGDVRSCTDARAMIAETGVDGIMIGRGALNNPWVFRQIADEMEGRPSTKPALGHYRELFDEFIRHLLEYRPEKLVLNRLKALIGWVSKGLPDGARLRQNVYGSKSLSEALGIFEHYFARELSRTTEPAGRT